MNTTNVQFELMLFIIKMNLSKLLSDSKIKNMIDPNNNKMTKYYLNSGKTYEEAVALSILTNLLFYSNLLSNFKT